MDMKRLMGDQDHIRDKRYTYIQGLSPDVRDIFERFDFDTQAERLSKSGLLEHPSPLAPTLRVGMQSWPLQRPEPSRDAGAPGLASLLPRGSQMRWGLV